MPHSGRPPMSKTYANLVRWSASFTLLLFSLLTVINVCNKLSFSWWSSNLEFLQSTIGGLVEDRVGLLQRSRVRFLQVPSFGHEILWNGWCYLQRNELSIKCEIWIPDFNFGKDPFLDVAQDHMWSESSLKSWNDWYSMSYWITQVSWL